MNQHILCVPEGNTHLLQCPVCSSEFKSHNTQLVCKNGHIFNIARNNYINFQQNNSESYSGKEHRHLVENGFFRGLESTIVNLLMREADRKESLTILDVGCGDGALLSDILLSLRWENRPVNAFGIDTAAKEVVYASKQDIQTTWVVGDGSQPPFKTHSIDVILNTLSLADYHEFSRVLKPDGIIIKTVTEANYAEELELLKKNKSLIDIELISFSDEHLYNFRHNKIQLSDEENELLQEPS